MKRFTTFAFALCALPVATSVTMAQLASDTEAIAKDVPAEFQKFEELLSGSSLRGHFTVDGKDLADLTEERYEINSVSKLPTGDLWLFKARIKYGDHDVTVPMPLQVKWSGKTPVITLDNVTIPGLGTFDARVLFTGNRYAGTWQHGDVGGHLFGIVEKKDAEGADKDEEGA